MGFARKIRRRQQQKFFKDFKKNMRRFKKQVVCSRCGHAPTGGEKIDDWHIDKDSKGIDLICTDCYIGEEAMVDE